MGIYSISAIVRLATQLLPHQKSYEGFPGVSWQKPANENKANEYIFEEYGAKVSPTLKQHMGFHILKFIFDLD